MAHVIYSGAFGVMKFIQQQAMECFSMDSGGANHVPPLRCRSPRRPVRGLGLGRSSGGALHEHDGHHFYSGPCAPLIYSPKTQIYFIHYAFPGAEVAASDGDGAGGGDEVRAVESGPTLMRLIRHKGAIGPVVS